MKEQRQHSCGLPFSCNPACRSCCVLSIFRPSTAPPPFRFVLTPSVSTMEQQTQWSHCVSSGGHPSSLLWRCVQSTRGSFKANNHGDRLCRLLDVLHLPAADEATELVRTGRTSIRDVNCCRETVETYPPRYTFQQISAKIAAFLAGRSFVPDPAESRFWLGLP